MNRSARLCALSFALSLPAVGHAQEALARDLIQHGFQVSPGYPMVYRDACEDYTYPALKSCFGNNPVSPYVIPVVKAWPEEFVGPTPVDAFGPVRPGYLPAYRPPRILTFTRP